MEIWVSTSYNINLVVNELNKWSENTTKILYHNVVQDWINSRFPCLWDKQIPIFLIIKENIIEKIDYNKNCSICMEDNSDLWKSLPCNHWFHKLCINKWLKKNRTCPLCRAKC